MLYVIKRMAAAAPPVSAVSAASPFSSSITRRIAAALPVAGSTSTTTPASRGSPLATSNALGTNVTVVASTRSMRRPRMLSYGPVMPTSLMNAVPPGRICSSAVGTCVCVPSTALTRPLR